jgi:hypothetical protein
MLTVEGPEFTLWLGLILLLPIQVVRTSEFIILSILWYSNKFLQFKKRKKGTSINSDLKLTAETSVLDPDPV